jgi:ABC-type branched-subunit amino acid transport system substrate-binding protein
MVDDGWDPAMGATFIQNFTKQDYFALPVVPSSEGLTQSILNGTISSAGMPVVGSDGMLKEQYSDPWVWPVATATVTTLRVMAKHAHDKGAKTFGIVYDTKYKFGKEGAAAFRDYVKQLTGSPPKADVGITPGKPSYSGDANAFNNACGAGGCDFVAMLLDPTTANVYISSNTDADGRRQGFGRVLTGGAQPLFNDRFARDCGKPCDGMLVWTGYNPPVGALSGLAGVSSYVNDVRSVDPGIDVNNQFLEGAYLGMQVFVEALKTVGPNVTRAALRDAMNAMTYRSDLASPLTWGPNQRFANQGAQAFRIATAAGSFAGFADAGTGFIKDPTPGVVPK